MAKNNARTSSGQKQTDKQKWKNLSEEEKAQRLPRPLAFLWRHRDGPWTNLIFCVLVPLVAQICCEWIARGSFADNAQGSGFFQALGKNYPSFLISYILLLVVYVFVSQLSCRHSLATALVGLLGIVPAIVTHYKLTLRGEPFLPWDLSQIGDLLGVSDNLSFEIPVNLYISIGIFVVLGVLAGFVKLPRGKKGKPDLFIRLVSAAAALVCGCILVFGIFLNPKGTKAMGIREDMWMQDRYYRNHGVITGFLTNLQMLQISQPDGYSTDAVDEIAAEVETQAQTREPYFEDSFAAQGQTVQQPNIIYVMAESFWDVTALPGIEYDQPLLPNLTRLSQEGARGTAYSPSFGGGTCDVEFEVLTGFSVEYLPAGAKPYQQYITQDTFSLPQYLKQDGYETIAIHGYGRRFWNRDVAYPRLGLDTFIASDDFVNPEKRRGFISDNAMVDMIIEQMQQNEGSPVFIHAVTMQNHTTYSRDRYPAEDLVRVVDYPAALSDSTIGQLEDCATGIREMDAALGKLCDYLREEEYPTIVVFWGDHSNPMNDGYRLFEETGYIEKGDTSAPILHETPLLIWSNFDDSQVELGTLSTYNISAAMMDLYGLEKPLMFEFLTQQMDALRGRTRGITIALDGSYGEDMDERQQEYFRQHAILQYNYLFDDRRLEQYIS